MEKHIDLKKRIASMTSNILNPFLVGLLLIVMLSFTSTANTKDALKWSVLAIGMSLLPVFLLMLFFMHQGSLDNFFISVRQQRTKIYLFGFFFSSVCCAILAYLDAPFALVALFATGLSSVFIFALINFWWKISIHTAIIAGMATMLILMYGWVASASVVLVPLTAWARIELKNHSPAQTVIGAVLATVIVVGIFYPLALA